MLWGLFFLVLLVLQPTGGGMLYCWLTGWLVRAGQVCRNLPHNEDLTCSNGLYASDLVVPLLLPQMTADHTHYFGVEVGEYCSSEVGV